MRTVTFAIALGVALVSAGPFIFEDASDIVIDTMLKEMSEDMTTKGLQNITINNFEKRYGWKIWILDLTIGLTATNGWLEDMTTLKRVGPSYVNTRTDGIDLDMTVGLDPLKFGFNNVEVSIFGFKSTSKLEVTVGKNEGRVQCGIITTNGSCHTEITQIAVTNFKDITVDIKGQHSFLDWIANKLGQFILSRNTLLVQEELAAEMKENIVAALKKDDFCKAINN